MKKIGLTAARYALPLVGLMAGVVGYVCYERTLVAWWLPVELALLAALLTAPLLFRCWSPLTGMRAALPNLICHVAFAGAVAYFALLGANCCFADPATEYETEVEVAAKSHVVRRTYSTSGRRRVATGVRNVYYLELLFPDGRRKREQVTLQVYNRTGTGSRRTCIMRRGRLGYDVIWRTGGRSRPAAE